MTGAKANPDCPALLALGEARERIHRRANDYFAFDLKRWDEQKWRLLFGASDALLDTEFALSNLPAGVPTVRQHAILSCYGFLQALYIQQDAVCLIWKALDLPGDPLADPGVQDIRELRNRIAGHPARAEKMGKGKRSSSAIINLHDINPLVGFKAVIYYDGDVDVVDVTFSERLADNAAGLLEPLLEAERTMVGRETAFREDESKRPLSAEFESGLTYTLEKLRCDPGDSRRDMALRMLENSVDALETTLKARNFWYSPAEYHIAAIRAGIRLGEALTGSPDGADQQSWWVISEGIDSHVQTLRNHVRALDDKLATPPDA